MVEPGAMPPTMPSVGIMIPAASPAWSSCFGATLHKMPQPVGYVYRQAMTGRAGDHHDLPAVVRLVRDEVGEDVADVELEVAPDIGRCGRNRAAAVASRREERAHALAAALQRRNQFALADRVAVDAGRHGNLQIVTERLDPGTT